MLSESVASGPAPLIVAGIPWHGDLRYHRVMDRGTNDAELQIGPRRQEFAPGVIEALEAEIGSCPDVAFAYLPDVLVHGRQSAPESVLFVWLVPEALGSLRFALNLVSEAVARVLPGDTYLDVVVLNSAPELLERLEGADCLLVERVAEERRRALEAAWSGGIPEPLPRRRWWWPF